MVNEPLKVELVEKEFKSKYEKNFWENRDAFEKEFGVKVKTMRYEPMTFMINQDSMPLKYTPDFYVVTECNRVFVVEIKPTKKAKDYYYTRARVIAMSLAFPEFNWVIALQKPRSDTEWKFETC